MAVTPRYTRQGECLKCGSCCVDEDCEHFDPPLCKIHDQKRPPKCEWFPEAPPIIFEKCGYYFMDTWEDNKFMKRHL